MWVSVQRVKDLEKRIIALENELNYNIKQQLNYVVFPQGQHYNGVKIPVKTVVDHLLAKAGLKLAAESAKEPSVKLVPDRSLEN
jgi:hypothetical protein